MRELSTVGSAVLLTRLRVALTAIFITASGLALSQGLSVLSVLWLLACWVLLALIWFFLSRYRASVENEYALLKAQTQAPQQAEGAFLASMGHDLRQPAQAIALFAATLSAHPLPESSRKLISGVESAVQQLSEQMEAVFSIARAVSGQLACELRPVGLEGVFLRAVGGQLDEAHERQLHLRRVSTARSVLADEALLLRTIDRMLAHALCVTEAGGVVLGCRVRGDVVLIEVWDSSAGIAPELVSAVFVPGSVYGQNLPDRGLGLVLARHLAALMHGHLSISSTVGRGSLLRLSLPRA